jgi:hypothetical protein
VWLSVPVCCVLCSGFVQDGNKCLEINSCATLPPPCHANAQCLRTGPGTHVCMCAVGYEGDGLKECKMKAGWEAVLMHDTGSGMAGPTGPGGMGPGGLNMVLGPDGVPVLQDNQAQKDLRAKMEEERIKAQFAERERDRTRRIHELQSRIMEYEEMRRHRQVAQDEAEVRKLEKRVASVARSSADIAAQKQEQMRMLMDLKDMEMQRESALRDLVQEKADLVLEKSKEEARRLARLARRPVLPNLTPADPSMPLPKLQNYADAVPVPNLPRSAGQEAADSTASTPIEASRADLPGAGASHQSGLEAAYKGTISASYE